MNPMNALTASLRIGLLSAALTLAVLPQASAQTMDHSKMKMPMPATPAPAKKPTPAKKPASAKKPAPAKPAPVMDHSRMDMPMPAAKPAPAKKPAPARKTAPVRKAPAAAPKAPPAPVMDHSSMEMPTPATPVQPQAAEPMDHSAMPGMQMDVPSKAPSEPVTPIPPLTDADREAARPPALGHTVHDNSIQRYLLLNRLEAWNADPGTGLGWEAQGWIGTDLDRLWLRSEGERVDGSLERADLEVLYGRSVSRWWDVVAGVRQDFGAGPSQTFAAVGVQGFAPYKFDIEATAYIGQSGQTAARFEAEYDTLLTNRLILQWQAEADLYGRDDARRGIGSGLSTIEAGVRLRYEFTRQFAPYIGIARERAFGGTADFRRGEGESINDTRVVAGLRIWF